MSLVVGVLSRCGGVLVVLSPERRGGGCAWGRRLVRRSPGLTFFSVYSSYRSARGESETRRRSVNEKLVFCCLSHVWPGVYLSPEVSIF